MNLLKVQDALKNASDQQLMTLMQAPDSTAPSYLVLSEIRRRKEMRAQQAPEGQSNRTVADDLIAQDDGGIRDIVAHDEPEAQDGAEEMAAGGLASLRRYAEGGVVRMQAGGQPPRPVSELSEEDLLRYQDYFLNQQRPLISGGRVDRARFARIPAVSSPYDFISIANELDRRAGVTPPQMFSPQNEGVALLPATRADDIYRSVSSLPAFVGEEGGPSVDPQTSTTTTTAAQPPTPTTTTTPPPAAQPPAARPASPAAAQPTPAPAAQAQGIEGLRNAPTGIPEGGQLPTMAELMRQNAALFPDGMSGIRDRMREERVDPAARRSEAVNMALIEAGLRIAGSRNPSLIGAIGEGALPAVQSYSQQLGQIRGEQRQARQDELELAKQDTNRQFAIGQISAAEYRSRMDNINRNIQVNAQERGANARLAASESAANRRADRAATAAEEADLRRGYASPERLARMTSEERAAFERIRTIGRPLDTSGVQGAYNATVRQIDGIRSSMEADPRPAASSRNFAEWQQRDTERRARLQQAENQLREYRDILVTGRAPGGSGGTTQGAPNSSGRPDLSSFAR
jgi:hypothetical protein